jgi:hypothetical protein
MKDGVPADQRYSSALVAKAGEASALVYLTDEKEKC